MNLNQVMLAEGAIMRTALVFCGGGPSRAEIPVLDDPLVIAADIGAIEAHRLGFGVGLLVGDMDSIPAATRERIEREGGRIQQHPRDKDATDLDLALSAALQEGVERAVIVGGDGGRLDQLLGNALIMVAPRFAGIRLDAIFGHAQAHAIHRERALQGRTGETISLFAVADPARGVRTTGLRWPLDGRDLEPGSSLGISNEFSGSLASIEVRSGAVLAIRPGETS